jgi:signal transduction histidine kinase
MKMFTKKQIIEKHFISLCAIQIFKYLNIYLKYNIFSFSAFSYFFILFFFFFFILLFYFHGTRGHGIFFNNFLLYTKNSQHEILEKVNEKSLQYYIRLQFHQRELPQIIKELIKFINVNDHCS